MANASPEGVTSAKKNGNRSYSRLSEQNVQTVTSHGTGSRKTL